MTTASYQVIGMTCGHCESAVRAEVEQIPGVTGVQVSARTGRLVLTADAAPEDALVLAAVDEAGYEAIPIR